MSTSINVEALLDSTDAAVKTPSSVNSPASESRRHDRPTDHHNGEHPRDRDHNNRGSDHRRERRAPDLSARIEGHRRGNGNHNSRHRTRSRDRSGERPRSRVSSFSPDADERYDGSEYRRSAGRRGHGRSRSRSPRRDRSYRPRDDRRRQDHRRSHSPRDRRSPSPKPTDDERDRRTIFVQQLANRLRSKDLIQFFAKAGPVLEAQIVKDRVSGRSKGVGYVEFKDEESVKNAIEMTGQSLLGIPIIAQHTEAEKNRLARNTNGNDNAPNPTMYQRLYVGNVHFSITESDLKSVFEPFGELEMVTLQKDEATGRSRGFGFVQFVDPLQAREALEEMNGFDIAGRPIRVGLGNEKFTPESTANLLQRHPGNQTFAGSAFSGSGGRGRQTGGGPSAAREEKATAGASALDDTDVAGVNFSNYSREALMRKLARTDEPNDTARTSANANTHQAAAPTQLRPVAPSRPSKTVLVKNVFSATKEEELAPGGEWVKEIQDDFRHECDKSYGPVEHIRVDPTSEGDVYVKFKDIESAQNSMKSLNGRFFDGRTLTAQYMVEAVYNSINSLP